LCFSAAAKTLPASLASKVSEEAELNELIDG
jgi:hypothetical protein